MTETQAFANEMLASQTRAAWVGAIGSINAIAAGFAGIVISHLMDRDAERKRNAEQLAFNQGGVKHYLAAVRHFSGRGRPY